MTTDEMKLARDGQLAYGPVQTRHIVERTENGTVFAHYALVVCPEQRSDPTLRRFGDHEYVMYSGLSSSRGKGVTLTINDHLRSLSKYYAPEPTQ